MANPPTEDDTRRSRPDQHFDDRYWIDMVRGFSVGNHAVEMQRHLDEGCEVCRRDRDIWLGLVNTGKGDALYEPPEELIQRVKKLFSKREAVSFMSAPLFCVFQLHTPALQ
jgi:hypothetical protein